MNDGTMCYAIKYPGHVGYGQIMTDKPQYAKSNAKEIAKAIREGGIVEHVPVERAKAGMLEYIEADRA